MSPTHCTYDFFVLYAPDADAWVQGELLPRLREIGLKVGTRDDLRPGDYRPAAYEEAVQSSRRVVVVAYPALAADREMLAVQYLTQAESWRTTAAKLIALCLDGASLPARLSGKMNLTINTGLSPGRYRELVTDTVVDVGNSGTITGQLGPRTAGLLVKEQ